jgi:aminoglycoside phosphotransferase (APT) family kinase protein
MHDNQLDVPTGTARRLIGEQFPAWRRLSVTAVPSSGTVNAIFRVGDRLAARFPLVVEDVDATRRSLEDEARAARSLVGRTRFATPEPVAIGEPGAGYPGPWSVQTWVPGIAATDEDPGESVGFALDLAELVHDVRAIDTGGRAFAGQGRGGDLRAHEEWMRTCFERSERLLDVARVRALWEVLRELPRADGPDVTTHGDLIPGNVLVSEGRLTGVLDVGGLGPADPALDLVAAWHLLERAPRAAFRRELGCGDLEWARGQAWALEQAMGAVWYYVRSNPAMSRMGRRTIDRILADPAPYGAA